MFIPNERKGGVEMKTFALITFALVVSAAIAARAAFSLVTDPQLGSYAFAWFATIAITMIWAIVVIQVREWRRK